MATSSSTPAISKSLTADQLLRIEQNKKVAREKLLAKRKRIAHDSFSSNPHNSLQQTVSKQPAPQNSYLSSHVYQYKNPGISSSGLTHQLDLKSSSYAYPSNKCPSKKAQPFSSPPCTTKPPSSAHHPPVSKRLSPPVYQSKPTITSSTSTNPTCFSTHQSKPNTSAATAGTSGQLLTLQKKIKANFVMVSKERFKVVVPFDARAIEIFKGMGTRLYDAKNSTWSFAVEDYNHLVDSIRKECKHIEMNLIPKAVIKLFQHCVKSTHQNLATVGSTATDWTRISSKLSSTLMQFQREGVEYSIRRGGRVLIADDMGLGKTLQAIAIMNYYHEDWPLLVVCPSSVRLAWAQAFHRWLPSLQEEDVNVFYDSKSRASRSLVNIISYDLAVRMAKELRQRNFDAVVADESHFLKNMKTARYKALAPIVKRAKHSLLLSGTPALSRPIELFTQINMLDRNFQSVSMIQFGIRYCNGFKDHFGWNFSGASNMQELQMYMEEAVMIRRMKSDVLDQLPTKRRQMVLLDPALTKAKSKYLKDMKQELNRAGKLKAKERKSALLPLYEKTGRIKIAAVNNYILDLMEGGRKLIVFGHHKSMLDSICESLTSKSYGHIRIDGRTAAEVRQTYCDRFQHDEICLVAVLSITTANAGLNLTAASTVVFAELFWNPGILVQAEDRAYRIGQHNSVNIYYLVAQDTADDFIWPLIQVKLEVLCQAGLAKEDFSKADSTTVKDTTQKNLFDCFNQLVSEAVEDSLPSEDNSPKASVTEPAINDSTNANMSNWFNNLNEEDLMDNLDID